MTRVRTSLRSELNPTSDLKTNKSSLQKVGSVGPEKQRINLKWPKSYYTYGLMLAKLLDNKSGWPPSGDPSLRCIDRVWPMAKLSIHYRIGSATFSY
jgi:hypothetical protein